MTSYRHYDPERPQLGASYRHYDPERPQMGGLKKLIRKATGPLLAIGAVAAGQPQLAVAAYSIGKSATAGSPKAVEPPTPPVTPPGIAGFWAGLTQGDRNALTIGGSVVGTLIVARILKPKKAA